MASATPPVTERTYHVFLSYKNKDCGHNIVGHLYRALKRAGIYTYLDKEELDKGERIDALLSAIEDSCIALIVFSETYAASKWCLKEATKAMKWKDSNGLLVLPMFLGVDPGELRGRASYEAALDGYEKDCNNNKAVRFSSEDVKDWRKALKDAADLSGWVYQKRKITVLKDGNLVEQESKENKDEAEFVVDVVQYISERLERIPLHVDEDIVGMQSQVDNVKSILNRRSEDGVQDRGLMVGLWGMGCLGKSTLAKLIYNSIFKEFQGAAFIEIGSDSIGNLQQTMLRTLLTRAKLRVANRHEGIASMKERLKTKRILLVLDGPEEISQIDCLIGKGSDLLKNGSRIIVTTRNKRVLLTRGATIYEVKALEDDEAHQLLRKCASENGEQEISEDHVERVLQCTGRVPLALRELGSKFLGKNDDGRGTELEKFEKWSDEIIHKKLVKSFDGLDDDTRKDIFLDIACFFNGWKWNRKYVEGFLGVRHVKRDNISYDAAASKANDYVNDLVERSLITAENGTLQVHPLIKLMGQKVAGGELAQDLDKRRRLWSWTDVHKVLLDHEREYAVEAIVLAPKEPKVMKTIDSNAFRRLKKLSLLILINVKVENFPDCIDLPRHLRWFEWPDFPASRLKFFSDPWHPAVLALRKTPLLSSRD